MGGGVSLNIFGKYISYRGLSNSAFPYFRYGINIKSFQNSLKKPKKKKNTPYTNKQTTPDDGL